MVEKKPNQYVDRIVSSIGDQLESIISYPHPFNKNGWVVVFKNEVETITDGLAKVYQYPPADLTIHCLRRSELFELSMPSIRGKLHPLLIYWLKYRGEILYGKDLRSEIITPEDPESILENLIESTKYMRGRTLTSGILYQLSQKRYLILIRELHQQIQFLMATAMLTRNFWDITLATLAEEFKQVFGNGQIEKTIDQFIEIAQQEENGDEELCRRFAFTAVWLFERFLIEMGGITKCR